METTGWKLNTITDDIECTMDNSGIYCNINRIVNTESSKGYVGQAVSVRVDIMASAKNEQGGFTSDYPVMSFVGKADNVRKAVIEFLENWRLVGDYYVSLEHASYIGSEIACAECNEHYKQS